MIAREYGIILVPVDRRPGSAGAARRCLAASGGALPERFAKDVEVRLGRRLDQPVVWIRLKVGPDAPAGTLKARVALAGATVGPVSRAVWAGIPIRDVDSTDMPMRLTITLGRGADCTGGGDVLVPRTATRAAAVRSPANAVDKVAPSKRPIPCPRMARADRPRRRNVNRMAAISERLEQTAAPCSPAFLTTSAAARACGY